MVLVEEVIFSSFIRDSHQVIFSSLLVRQNAIDFAHDQGNLVSGVIEAKRQWLGCFHV